MNPIVLTLFFMASAASATFVVTTTATAATLTATQAASIVAGIGLVKAIAVGALAGAALLSSSRSRGRREAVTETVDLGKETDAVFNLIQDNEPQACLQRLICDIATGFLPPSENDVILSLFEVPDTIDENSPMKKFANAAKMGKMSRNIKNCEVRYSCPLNGLQIEELLL